MNQEGERKKSEERAIKEKIEKAKGAKMTNPVEKMVGEKGKTEKLASTFGETIKVKKENEKILKLENVFCF